MKNQIQSVRIETVIDSDPDASYLGKFTDNPSPNAIIRVGEHTGKFVRDLGENDELPTRGREYRFFLPALTAEETGNPDSPHQDWQRMENLNDGNWCYIGIIAKATIVSGNGIGQTLRSGGLFGIESDSGSDHLESIEKEQLEELRSELESFGFGKRAIDYSFKNCMKVNK